MANERVVQTKEISSQTRLELIKDLEKNIFFLLVTAIGDEIEEKLEPIEMTSDEEEAQRLFRIVSIMSLFNTNPEILRTMANNKVLSELFGIPARTVTAMENLQTPWRE